MGLATLLPFFSLKVFNKNLKLWIFLKEISDRVAKDNNQMSGYVWISGRRLLFSHQLMSNSLWPHGLQHPRLSSPSPSPGVCPSSCPSNQWCHSTISSSVALFSFCLQSFPASGSFPMNQFFTSGDHSTGVSASASVLSVNTQDWFPLGWTCWISLLSKGLSRFFSSTTAWKHQFFGDWLSAFFMVQFSHPHMTTGKTIALTIWTFLDKVMSLLFSTLSRLCPKYCMGLGLKKIIYLEFKFNWNLVFSFPNPAMQAHEVQEAFHGNPHDNSCIYACMCTHTCSVICDSLQPHGP